MGTNEEDTNKDKQTARENSDEVVQVENSENEGPGETSDDTSAWITNKYRGFKRVSPVTEAAPKRVSKGGSSSTSASSPLKKSTPTPPSTTTNEGLQNLAKNNSTENNQGDNNAHHRENIKYCHFYTNYGKCQYEEKTGLHCRFEHKSAPMCRAGMACTRHKCMYTHPNPGGRRNTFLGDPPSHQMRPSPWQQMTNTMHPMMNPWTFMPMAQYQQPMEQLRGRGVRTN